MQGLGLSNLGLGKRYYKVHQQRMYCPRQAERNARTTLDLRSRQSPKFATPNSARLASHSTSMAQTPAWKPRSQIRDPVHLRGGGAYLTEGINQTVLECQLRTKS